LDDGRPIGLIFHQLQACLAPASAQLAHRQQGRWQVHAGSHLVQEVSIRSHRRLNLADVRD